MIVTSQAGPIPNNDPEIFQSSMELLSKKLKHLILTFKAEPSSSHLIKVSIEINDDVTAAIHKEIVELFKRESFEGFKDDAVPSEYIEENFKDELHYRLKNYIFRHLVSDYLTNELIARKVPLANYPRLTSIEKPALRKFVYNFDVSTADLIELKEWKLFAFKSPKRKRYKDLDKQVVQFVEQQVSETKKQNPDLIEENDWACFEATLLTSDLTPIHPSLVSCFWIKVKNHDLPDPFKVLFLGKTVGSEFATNKLELGGTINYVENKKFNFLITIKAIIKGSSISLDLFKTTFKLKNKQDIHNKLMEVFSYRNDISQRKTIIEEIFHLLLSKHRFEIPKHLILRRVEDILLSLMKQPDYQVYRSQKDFLYQVEQLAEKQLKEEIIIDQITFSENLKIDLRDMQQYLHLFNSRRLREFVYFKAFIEKPDDLDTPINAHLLGQTVLREKTLNHIIHTLTR